ncbi:MAG TPA: ATP-binding protein [Pilimelia sp.]|nr:ATP-binding protein [Pilimelia sp.]
MKRLRGTPLVVKLVASVLVLVVAALGVISVASGLAMRSYLMGRVDQQLYELAVETANRAEGFPRTQVGLPTDFYGRLTSIGGIGDEPAYDYEHLTQEDLPPLVAGLAEVQKHLGVPYTVKSHNGHVRWRMLVTICCNGSVLHLGLNLSEVDGAVGRLVWIDVLVGGVVLILLASLGAGIVRASLRPLTEIEQTAAAIADGDLTRRVPDPEPGEAVPRTELGRLSRALNAMLAQIEAAFTARAESETAARAAEAAARDAAIAAQLSEARARRSEERMRQFVADASHELRTPLTTIRGFAELYRQGGAASPAEGTKLIRRIEDEAARMGLLVEDLLLLARLDEQRPLVMAPVELPVLAIDAVQAARAVAPGRPIELEIEPGAGNVVVLGDDARLRQVLGNLMTNAVRHTPPEASVTLRLSTEPDGVAVIEVADTGPGLSAEQAERVFERFYRIDAARTRRLDGNAGTGLGLAIVAALVAAHHGTVELDSTPGEGATFRVRLPLAPEDGEIPSQVAAA